jgi:hypothetical protein
MIFQKRMIITAIDRISLRTLKHLHGILDIVPAEESLVNGKYIDLTAL